MKKLDYQKQLKDYYQDRVGGPIVVQVPEMNFMMIDGKGDPNTGQEYTDALQALYPLAYAIKFICKNELGSDFGVMPLEGLWWTGKMANFNPNDKSDWFWTAMIMQPDIVTRDIFDKAVFQLKGKKNPPSIDKVRFESYDEGRAAQVMYIGPYSGEGPAITELHEFIKQNDGKLDDTNKHHHEIYLGDPRRTDPSKLKTIIRQPF